MIGRDFYLAWKATFPRFDGLVVALGGYFDDAGTHGATAELAAVAGFLFDDDGLSRLTAGWAALSGDLVAPFKTRECLLGWGQFATWDDTKRDALLRGLARLIGETRGPAFFSCVEPPAFNAYIAANPKAEKYLGNQFALCVMSCLTTVGQWADKAGHADGVDFWFENGTAGEKTARDFVFRVEKNPTLRNRFRLGRHTFIPKNDTAALLAADFLATGMRRHILKTDQQITDLMKIMHAGGKRPLYVTPLDPSRIGIHGMVNAVYRLDRDPPDDAPPGWPLT